MVCTATLGWYELKENTTEVYYKMRQGFCYKMQQFHYKCGSYCKMGQFYYEMRQLLQNTTFITNCDSTLTFYQLKTWKCFQHHFVLIVEVKNNVVEDANVLKTVFPILNFPNANVFVTKSPIYSFRVQSIVPYKNCFHFAFVVFTYLKVGFLHTNYFLKLLGGYNSDTYLK